MSLPNPSRSLASIVLPYALSTWLGHVPFTLWLIDMYRHDETCSPRILRMKFEEATSYFSDGSMDLLHFDGLRTCDAARHALGSLPELSDPAAAASAS